jgi:hypothetical protein
MKLTKLLFVSILLLFTSIVYGGSREDWQAVVDAMALTGYEVPAADIEAALGTVRRQSI